METIDDEEEVLCDYDVRALIGCWDQIPPEDLRNLLERAVAEDNVANLRHCLRDNRNVNLVNDSGDTCLHTAVRWRSLNSLRYLTSLKETDLNVRNNRGRTPLLLAVGDDAPTDILSHLLSCKSDVNIGNYCGTTPLHAAVHKQDSSIARLLIEGKADLNAKDDDGYTPLHEAVHCGHYETVCMLLHYNASAVNVVSKHNSTPFLLAIQMRKLRIAKLLVDYVVDFSPRNSRGHTAFVEALQDAMRVAVDIVERGGNVHEGYDGLPAIFILLPVEYLLFRRLWAEVDVKTLFGNCSNYRALQYFLCHNPPFSGEEMLVILETLFTAHDNHYYYISNIYKAIYELYENMHTRLKCTWMLQAMPCQSGPMK